MLKVSNGQLNLLVGSTTYHTYHTHQVDNVKFYNAKFCKELITIVALYDDVAVIVVTIKFVPTEKGSH